MFKKLLAAALSSAMLFGMAAALPEGVTGTFEITASADEFVSGDYECTLFEDGTVRIDKYNGSASSLVIPSSINGKKVTCIGSFSFWMRNEMKSVKIPEGVTEIQSNSFGYCSSLQSVSIPNSVHSVEEGAFTGSAIYTAQTGDVVYIDRWAVACNKKASSVSLRSDTRGLGEKLFSGCTNIKAVTIPNGVTAVSGAFYNSYIESVKLPASVTYLGRYTFTNSSVRKVSFSKGLKTIEESAFWCAKNIESLDIPESVTQIGQQAFANCEKLKTASLPGTLSKISDCMFQNCYELESVSIPNDLTEIEEGAFVDCRLPARQCDIHK